MDLKEMVDWMEHLNRTVQIVHRIKVTPRFSVRISRIDSHLYHNGDQWILGEDDDLSMAVEKALENYLTDPGTKEHE